MWEVFNYIYTLCFAATEITTAPFRTSTRPAQNVGEQLQRPDAGYNYDHLLDLKVLKAIALPRSSSYVRKSILFQWTVDGPILAYALKLVVVGPRAGCAASLHLPMAAKIVKAMRLRSATRKFAQVSACWFWRAQMSIALFTKLNAEL